MWHEFMQMGAPAGFVLAAVCVCLALVCIATQLNHQWRRESDQKHELERIEQAAKARQIEAPKVVTRRND